ncbi:MAG: methionyl-tRNA formyltransferase [Flavobacteriales bacterium]|nr:methionyl-tRNA formyltransferase [Flavobacteriales bacterium]
MRILFVGSKGLGYRALRLLHEQGADICGVVARWDDLDKQWYPSVASLARELNLPLMMPEQINDAEVVGQIAALQPDIMLTAFYPKIYKKDLLSIPPLGSVNMHFAPLPRYRGSYPGAWAIINGETSHGVTMHYMKPGVDNGEIIGQITVPIEENDSGQDLYNRCEEYGIQLLKETWPALLAGTAGRIPQDESRKLYHNRDYPYGGVVNFSWSVKEVCNYVRALYFPPFRGPFTFVNGKKLYVDKVVSSANRDIYGTCGLCNIRDNEIEVKVRDGWVKLITCSDEKAQQVSVAQLIDDYKVSQDTIFGR